MPYWICTFPVTERGATVSCGLQTSADGPAPPIHRCPSGHAPVYWDTPEVARRIYDERTGTTRHTVPASDAPEVAAPHDAPPPPVVATAPSAPLASRKRLPGERQSVTRTFRLRYKHKDGTDDVMTIYAIAGVYGDGRLGELFLKVDRMGSFAHGALDAAATMVSIMLQYGVPLSVVTAKLRHTRYEPSGFTGDREFPSCTSALDLVAQWLDKRFGVPSDPQ